MLRSLFRRPLVVLPALVLVLMLLALLWWVFPPRPRVGWQFDFFPGVSVSANGKTLAITSGNELTLWDTESSKLLGTQQGEHRLSVMCMSRSADVVVFQELVEYGSGGPHIGRTDRWPAKVWKPASGTEPIELTGPKQFMAYSPEANLLVLKDGTIKLWNLQNGKVVPIPEEMNSVSWAPDFRDGRILGPAWDEKGMLTIWDLTAQKKLLSATGVEEDLPGVLRPVVFAANGKHVAIKASHGVSVWDLATQQELLRLTQAQPEMLFSPDGKRFAAKTGTGITVWELPSGKEVAHFESAGLPWDFNQNGGWLVVYHFGMPNSTLKSELWRIDGKQSHAEPFAPDTIFSFSPDGALVLTARSSQSGPVYKVYALANLQSPMLEHEYFVLSNPQFSPDSRMVVHTEFSSSDGWLDKAIDRLLDRSGYRGVIRLWELPGGRELARLDHDHIMGLTSTFLPENRGLLVSDQKQVQIWDLPPRRPMWVEYGLPILFVLLILAGGWYCWRIHRM